MGRGRNRQLSMSDTLLVLPWWMLAIGSAASYLIFHNILPSAFAAYPLLSGVGMLVYELAWVRALLHALFALPSCLQDRSQRSELVLCR